MEIKYGVCKGYSAYLAREKGFLVRPIVRDIVKSRTKMWLRAVENGKIIV